MGLVASNSGTHVNQDSAFVLGVFTGINFYEYWHRENTSYSANLDRNISVGTIPVCTQNRRPATQGFQRFRRNLVPVSSSPTTKPTITVNIMLRS